MGTKTTTLATGWILDKRALLYHFYTEEPGQAAHPPLCNGPLLLTATVRRCATAEVPEGLPRRYENSQAGKIKGVGICTACANRHEKRK